MSKEKVGSETVRRGKEPWQPQPPPPQSQPPQPQPPPQQAPPQPPPPQASGPNQPPPPPPPPTLNGRPPFNHNHNHNHHRPPHPPNQLPHQQPLPFNPAYSYGHQTPMGVHAGYAMGPMAQTPSLQASSLSGPIYGHNENIPMFIATLASPPAAAATSPAMIRGHQSGQGGGPYIHGFPPPYAHPQPQPQPQPPYQHYPRPQHFAPAQPHFAQAQPPQPFPVSSAQLPQPQPPQPLPQHNGGSAIPAGQNPPPPPPPAHFQPTASRTPPPHVAHSQQANSGQNLPPNQQQHSLPPSNAKSNLQPHPPPTHHSTTSGRRRNVLVIVDPNTGGIVNEDDVKAAERENEEKEAHDPQAQSTPSSPPSPPPPSSADAPTTTTASPQPLPEPPEPPLTDSTKAPPPTSSSPCPKSPAEPAASETGKESQPDVTPAPPAQASPSPGVEGEGWSGAAPAPTPPLLPSNSASSGQHPRNLPPLIPATATPASTTATASNPEQNGHEPGAETETSTSPSVANAAVSHRPPPPFQIPSPSQSIPPSQPLVNKEGSSAAIRAQFATEVAKKLADSPSARVSDADASASAKVVAPSKFAFSPDKTSPTLPLNHNGRTSGAAAAATEVWSGEGPSASLSEPDVGGSVSVRGPQPLIPKVPSQSHAQPHLPPTSTPHGSAQMEVSKDEEKPEEEGSSEAAKSKAETASSKDDSETLAKYLDWEKRLRDYRSTIGARTYHPGPPPTGDKKYGRDILVIISEYVKMAELKPNEAALAQKEKCSQVKELYDLSKPGPSSGPRQSGGGFAVPWQSRQGPPVAPNFRTSLHGGGGGGGGGGGNRPSYGGRSSTGHARLPPRPVVIPRPSQKIELKKAENAWKPQDSAKAADELSRKLASVEDEAEKERLEREAKTLALQSLKKKVRGILNKITPTNFGELLGDFTELLTKDDKGPYDLPCSWNQEETEAIVEVIFDKAVEEPLQCQTYAELCQKTVNQQLQRPGNQPGQQAGSVFRNVLLKTCQIFFQANGDNVERPSDVVEKKLASATNETEKKKLQAELQELRNKEKRRITGNIRFIGELFKNNLLVVSIMHFCVLLLFKQTDEESLECLCKLLETVGRKLEQGNAEQDKFFTQIPSYYSKLGDYAAGKNETIKVSSRIKFMILDLIDYRGSKWSKKKGKKEVGPKKIEEVRVDFKSEQLQKQLDADKYMADQRMGGRGGGNMGRLSQGRQQQQRQGGQISMGGRGSLQPPPQQQRSVSSADRRAQAGASAASAGGRTEQRPMGGLKKGMESAENMRLGPGSGSGSWSRGPNQKLRSGGGSLTGSSKASSPAMSRESSQTREREEALRKTSEIAGGRLGGKPAATISTSASTPHISSMEGALSPPSTTTTTTDTDAFPSNMDERAKLLNVTKSGLEAASEVGFADFFSYLDSNVRKLNLDSPVPYIAACLGAAVTSNKEKLRGAGSELLRGLPGAGKDVAIVPRALATLIHFFVTEEYEEELPKLWEFLAEILADALSPKAGALKLRFSDFSDAFLKAEFKAKDLLALTLLRIQKGREGEAEVKRLWSNQNLMAVLKNEDAQAGLIHLLKRRNFPPHLLARIEGEVVDSEPEPEEPSDTESSASAASEDGGREALASATSPQIQPGLLQLDTFLTKGQRPTTSEIQDYVNENLSGLKETNAFIRALFKALMGSFSSEDEMGNAIVEEKELESVCSALGPVYVGKEASKEAAVLGALAEFCAAKGFQKGLVEKLSDVLVLESGMVSSEAFADWLNDPATSSMITKNGHLKSILLPPSTPSQTNP